MSIEWNPAPLLAAIDRAYEVSLEEAAADAEANSPSSQAGVELEGNTLVTTGIGAVFEKGRRAGYEIQPQNTLALKFPDGGFAAMAVGGEMAPEPYIGPAAERWANGGFQSTARSELSAQGF